MVKRQMLKLGRQMHSKYDERNIQDLHTVNDNIKESRQCI